MKIKEFTFNLEDLVLHQSKSNVIVGRAQYIGNPNMYFLQSEKEYKDKGVNFTRCAWAEEESLMKENKKV